MRGLAVLVAGLTGAAPPAPAAQPPRVEHAAAVFPGEGDAVGSRPLFRIAYAPPDLAAREIELRIALSGEGLPRLLSTERRGDGDWLPGEAGLVLFRPRRALRDGVYDWRVERWDGVAWRPEEDGPRRFRVDTVAPAAVEGLRVEPLAPPRDGVRLAWNPVGQDEAGGPEWVARYRVYRFVHAPQRRAAALDEIGTTVEPWFVDEPQPGGDNDRVFYRVVAEDAAGNVSGRQEQPVRPALRPEPDPAPP